MTEIPTSVDDLSQLLARQRYVADVGLSTVLFLALRLSRPLLIEGEAGVGKTELAKVLAQALGRSLIRLQCYDGLELSQAAYEWDHARQLLAIRFAEAMGERDREALSQELYSEKYLIRRPLLSALSPHPEGPPVLLIDEIDRADEPFDAYLLEVLSDFQISVPELGQIKAPSPPLCILTSNRTREIHDALKRRCLYHFLGYPSEKRELEIVSARAPQAGPQLAAQVVALVQKLRQLDLFKPPGVAETLDWVAALISLSRQAVCADSVDATLGVVLKYQDDIAKVKGPLAQKLVAEVKAQIPG
ncbi:MAG TPA: MoxR family ATPase [Pseudomonadota bacterium]|jgi:MoxR-like ATPase|nr:MoxR family ATPase [Pseudomonadota bacterium]HNF98581.1 MoxR family ATPase [Pseudomonadota bacterium]